jgi:gamma-glutamylcyclotransferase (GGCT)/AIG2-like uncharacterized protein YtfP
LIESGDSRNCSLLFVYGTLRRGCANPMQRLLTEHSIWMGLAGYQGKLYKIADYPGAVPSNNNEDRIIGELYRLHQPEWLLRQLDDYEECGPGFPQPAEYRRAIASIFTETGGAVSAWIYLYNRPVDESKRIVSGDFLDPAVAQ